MELIKCTAVGCMQPEMWNSAYEIAQHFTKYHPGYEATVVDGEIRDIVPVEEEFDATYGEDGPQPVWSSYYKPGSFEATFADIFQEAFDLLVERQKKYGPENIRQLGLWGVFGRFADDKVNRIRRAFNGTIKKGVLDVTLSDGDFDDESLEDALFDSMNYPGIMISQKRGVWGRPLQDDMDD